MTISFIVMAMVLLASSSCSININTDKGRTEHFEMSFNERVSGIEARNVTVVFDPSQPYGTLEIMASQNIIDHIEYTVHDGFLELGLDGHRLHGQDVSIIVPGGQFTKIEGEDGACFYGTFTADRVNIDLNDGSMMNCEDLIQTRTIDARIDEYSRLDLSGSCRMFYLECRAESLASCSRLISDYVDADIRDGSTAYVTYVYELDCETDDDSVIYPEKY